MRIRNSYQLFLVSILFITSSAYAQNDTISYYENTMEEVLQSSDEDKSVNYDDEIIELREKLTQPVNINTVNKEQLRQFPFLSDLQIENILAYLYIHGEMKSIYELQLIKEMDWQTIRYLSPFICAEPIVKKNSFPSFSELWKKGKREVMTRLDVPFYRREGYKDKYLGPPYYHSLRYTYQFHDRLFAGFSADKDPGEPFFARCNRKGYDAYSFYLMIHDIGRVKSLAIGDYRLSFGQGLVVSNNMLLGKSTYTSTMNVRTNVIRKHSSTDEINFFRGIAASFLLTKRLLLSAFLSYRKMDGTIKGDSLTSIYESGLHRSEKEADKRGAFGLFFTGANINYVGNNIQVGATAVYYQFNHPYLPTYQEYNKYSLRGSNFYNFSTDYSYRRHRISFAGEVALGRHGVAMLNRLQYSLSTGYNLLLFHRYYAHNYWAYFAHSFGDGSSVQNENGWFVAADIVPLRKVALFAAVDLISFPWWKYRISRPSQSADILFRCTYLPVYKVKIDFNYRYRQKDRDVTGSKGEDTRTTYQHSFRGRLNYNINSNLNLQTIADYRMFRQHGFNGNYGYQVTQSINYSIKKLPIGVGLQGSYFRTDNYDTRVYISERNLLYSFYIPSYQGTGLRLSLRVQYNINNSWLIIAHCGQTRYYNQNSIGSGDDKIEGNKKADLQLQLRMKF